MNEITGVAVDFGGTKIAVTRFVAGERVDEYTVATDGNASSEAQIKSILSLLNKVNSHSGDRIGVAVSGRVDDRGNWYAVNADTLTGVTCVALKKSLEAQLKQPVSVLNDAVAAGLAEARYGAGRDISVFAYITVSTGVGGVCVVDGQPMVSANGLAGHIGFLTSRGGTRQCGSGRIGTVESVASGRAMERSARNCNATDSSAKAVMAAHRQAQSWASDIVNASANAIAELSANLGAAVGIQKVVLGGSVGLSDGYIEQVAHYIEREPPIFRIPIAKAELGHQSVLVGALCVSNDHD